jgi:uncharacterized protein (TIGR02284 family)
MVTTIGHEPDPIRMLRKLIELDYDAIEAYDAAIQRLQDEESQAMMESFRADHERHTRDLGRCLRDAGVTPPTEGDIKRVLTKGKVVLAGLAGDMAILNAMKTNEDDTNTAYERAVAREDVSDSVREALRANLEEERRHRAWIQERLRQLASA